MATIVITKSPKVYSKAVDEMRQEMVLLLSCYKLIINFKMKRL